MIYSSIEIIVLSGHRIVDITSAFQAEEVSSILIARSKYADIAHLVRAYPW